MERDGHKAECLNESFQYELIGIVGKSSLAAPFFAWSLTNKLVKLTFWV